VPDPLAEEMAADLASDLGEAEAEGVSAEELLGSSVFDPRSFAASWAAERGIIPEPPKRGKARRPLVLVAFTALAAVTVLVTALLLATGEPKASLVASTAARPHLASPPPAFLVPPDRQVLRANLAAPIEWILLFVAIAALGFAAWLWANWGRSRAPGVPA
jgi:hypothetical protein